MYPLVDELDVVEWCFGEERNKRENPYQWVSLQDYVPIYTPHNSSSPSTGWISRQEDSEEVFGGMPQCLPNAFCRVVSPKWDFHTAGGYLQAE